MRKAIALLWILTFLFAAHAVKAADDYEELVKTNLGLRRQIEALETKYSSLEGERGALISRLKELQSENDKLSNQTPAKGFNIDQADIDSLKKKLDDATKMLAAVTKDRDAINKKLDGAQKRFDDMDKTIIAEVQKRLKSVQTERTEVYKVLQKQNADLQEEIQKLKEVSKKQLEDTQNKKTEADKAFQKQNVDLQAEVRKLKDALLKATSAQLHADPEISAKNPGEKQIKTKGRQNMDISQVEVMKIQLDKLEADLRAAKTGESLSRKEKEAVEKRFKQVKTESDKERLDMHFNLAVVYEQNKMFADAEREYYKCLQIDPYDADTHYNLGVLYDDKMNKTSAAITHYKRYLELRPKGESSENVRQWIFNAEQETRLGVEAK